MKKARIVLSFLLAVFAALAFALPWSKFGSWLYPAIGALSVLALSAATILLFSFFRVTETYEGDYCFDPANPFWVIMERLYEFNWGNRVSLCKAFWLTAIALALCAFLIFVICGMLCIWWSTPATLLCIPAIGVFLGGVACSSKLAKKYRWIEKALKVAAIAVTFSVFGYVCSRAVISIMHQYHCGVLLAMLIFLGYVLTCVAGIAAVVGLIAVTHYVVPQLKETWLGRLVKAFKQKTCPVLYVCNRQDYTTDDVYAIDESFQ